MLCKGTSVGLSFDDGSYSPCFVEHGIAQWNPLAQLLLANRMQAGIRCFEKWVKSACNLIEIARWFDFYHTAICATLKSPLPYVVQWKKPALNLACINTPHFYIRSQCRQSWFLIMWNRLLFYKRLSFLPWIKWKININKY